MWGGHYRMQEKEEAVLDLHDLDPSNALVALVAWLTYLHYIGKSNNWRNPWGDNRRVNAVIVTGEGLLFISSVNERE